MDDIAEIRRICVKGAIDIVAYLRVGRGRDTAPRTRPLPIDPVDSTSVPALGIEAAGCVLFNSMLLMASIPF
ncbi:hypothetical protein H0176_01085 [Methylorubrum populi]|uniref:Uncharacterized protein n=1 Tax=Methylorubrum rhodesianum TaxID=29427 RepID=A0ABU9Z504_9HYPH|nr:hypothetical protein [Methylorubrum rhodesianum]MBK3405242.1 hypothetical protein [Methylorubrum rhodesianum]MBY0138869.1 hypothetical protein [Methylorubrum populi]